MVPECTHATVFAKSDVVSPEIAGRVWLRDRGIMIPGIIYCSGGLSPWCWSETWERGEMKWKQEKSRRDEEFEEQAGKMQQQEQQR